MKLKVKHITENGRRVRRKAPLYYADIVPIRKGIWYIDADFTIRTDVMAYGSGKDEYQEEVYFETNKNTYVVLEITSDEKVKFNIFASMSKTHYRGIIIEEKMVHKAIDKMVKGT